MRKYKLGAIYVMLLVAVLIITACSGSDNLSRTVAESAPILGGGGYFATADAAADGGWSARAAAGAPPPPAATPAPASAPGLAYSPQASPGQVDWEDVAGAQERHIIQNASVEMETEDFNEVVSELRQLAPAANGYVESEMLTQRGQRMFSIVLRIPAARFETALRHVESLADVRFSNQRAEDVTDRFYDIIGNLETRQIEEERILALIDAATNVNELLALETRLSNTRLTIEQYQAQLNNMAGLIAYSTINVTLFDIYQEVVLTAGPTLGERIGGAFGDSVDGVVNAAQGFIVFMAGAVIPLVILGVIVFAVYKVVRVLRRRFKTFGV